MNNSGRGSSHELDGEVVKEVLESTKWDLVVEFESGKILRVYDAKWRIDTEGHDAE